MVSDFVMVCTIATATHWAPPAAYVWLHRHLANTATFTLQPKHCMLPNKEHRQQEMPKSGISPALGAHTQQLNSLYVPLTAAVVGLPTLCLDCILCWGCWVMACWGCWKTACRDCSERHTPWNVSCMLCICLCTFSECCSSPCSASCVALLRLALSCCCCPGCCCGAACRGASCWLWAACCA